MSNAKAKTINLLLYEGDLGGVISIEDSMDEFKLHREAVAEAASEE